MLYFLTKITFFTNGNGFIPLCLKKTYTVLILSKYVLHDQCVIYKYFDYWRCIAFKNDKENIISMIICQIKQTKLVKDSKTKPIMMWVQSQIKQ